MEEYIDILLNIIARKFNISNEDILAISNDEKCALARMMFIYILRDKYKYRFVKIGKLLNDRDWHVIYEAYKTINKELNDNNELYLIIESILHKFEEGLL